MRQRVNLPRWGLKLKPRADTITYRTACKFTPLGFETSKPTRRHKSRSKCKFTPLGFETQREI